MSRLGVKHVGVVLALLGTLSLNGCWLQFGYGSEHQHWNPFEDRLTTANAASLRQSWVVDFADVDEVNSLGGRVSAPIVDGGRVIVTLQDAGRRAHVEALDLSTGAVAWDTVLDPARTAPSLASDPVILDGQVQATSILLNVQPDNCPFTESRLDPATGAVVSQVQTNPLRPFWSVPSGDRYVQFAHIYTAGRCDQLDNIAYAVRDTTSAATLWYADGDLQQSMPMVANGRIFASEPQRVVSWDLAGCGASICPPDWTVHVGQYLEGLTVANGRLFGAQGGEVVAVDVTSRQVAWRGATGAPSGPLAYANGLVFTASDSVLQAFDANGCGLSTCPPVWSATLPDPEHQRSQDIAVAGGVLYVARGSLGTLSPVGNVLAFPADGCGSSTCAPLWASPERSGRVESVVVSDGTLLTTVNDSHGRPDQLVAYTPS